MGGSTSVNARHWIRAANMQYCRIHRVIDCKKCQDPRTPKNEFRHRMARKEAGLTICFWCKDSGYINTFSGGGMGRSRRIGCRMDSHKCSCRCRTCDQLATFENGYCADHQEDVPTPIDLGGLLDS